jgi:predicted dienelactone hydrolase
VECSEVSLLHLLTAEFIDLQSLVASPGRSALGIARYLGLVFQNTLQSSVSKPQSPPAVKPSHAPYPVVLHAPGLAVATTQNILLCQELASNNHIVVAIWSNTDTENSPGRSYDFSKYSDQVYSKSQDMSFVVDKLSEMSIGLDDLALFKGMLDLDKIIAFGCECSPVEACSKE